jgi:hypothetical protein
MARDLAGVYAWLGFWRVLIVAGAPILYRPRPWRETALGAGYFSAEGGKQTPVVRMGNRRQRQRDIFAARKAVGHDSRRPIVITKTSPLTIEYQTLTVSRTINMRRIAGRTRSIFCPQTYPSKQIKRFRSPIYIGLLP